MSSVEPARHALYSELERKLGPEHAETLMTHLPQHRSAEAATKSDFANLQADINARFDRMEDRLDRMQRLYVTVSFGTLTVMTAVFALITRM